MSLEVCTRQSCVTDFAYVGSLGALHAFSPPTKTYILVTVFMAGLDTKSKNNLIGIILGMGTLLCLFSPACNLY